MKRKVLMQKRTVYLQKRTKHMQKRTVYIYIRRKEQNTHKREQIKTGTDKNPCLQEKTEGKYD